MLFFQLMERGERGWIAVNLVRLEPGYENVSVTRQLRQITVKTAQGPVMKMHHRYITLSPFPVNYPFPFYPIHHVKWGRQYVNKSVTHLFWKIESWSTASARLFTKAHRLQTEKYLGLVILISASIIGNYCPLLHTTRLGPINVDTWQTFDLHIGLWPARMCCTFYS